MPSHVGTGAPEEGSSAVQPPWERGGVLSPSAGSEQNLLWPELPGVQHTRRHMSPLPVAPRGTVQLPAPRPGARHKGGSFPPICSPNTDASTLLHLCSAIFQLKGLIMP